MRHVREIRNIIDQGQYAEAHEALDSLLSLGPGNTEALKLKSILYAQEGRFGEEAELWEKVFRHDEGDPDAIFFFQRRHMEERETFYFTDHLPGGGRRFLAHPRALINASLAGLMGCVLFLLLSSFSKQYYPLDTPLVSFSLFGVLVLLPWLLIVLAYLRSLREVLVTAEGIKLVTRLRSISLGWQDVSEVYLSHTATPGLQKLSLLVQPKDPSGQAIEIDLARESSPIRARACFIDEIARLFRKPTYAKREEISLDSKRIVSF